MISSASTGIIEIPIGKYVFLQLWECDAYGIAGTFYEIGFTYFKNRDETTSEWLNEDIVKLPSNFFEYPGLAILNLGKILNLILEIASEEDFELVKEKINDYQSEGLI